MILLLFFRFLRVFLGATCRCPRGSRLLVLAPAPFPRSLCLLFSVLNLLGRCPQQLVLFRLISAMLICRSSHVFCPSLQFLLRILPSPSLQFSVMWVLTMQVLFHLRLEFPVLGTV